MTEPVNIFPRVIDATMRSDWRACPHRFWRRHVQGLVKGEGEVSVHLHFGAALAKGLEETRREFCSHGDTRDAFKAGCEALIAAWGDFEHTPRTRNEANKTLGNCLLALQEYFREWPLDDDFVTIHRHDGKPCVEFSFAFPIPGSRHPDTGEEIAYAGRFDFIGDYQNSIYGVDDKTTGSDVSGDRWRSSWKLRGQFSGYCHAARLYGMPMKGFIVRGVQVLTSSIECGWALAPRPPWMVDAWLRQLQTDVDTMISQYVDLKLGEKFGRDPANSHPFPQDFSDSCVDFGSECAFMDLCTSEHPDRWLDGYSVRRWNPLTREEG